MRKAAAETTFMVHLSILGDAQLLPDLNQKSWGLWDFAWRIHREVNFSPRISGHCLPTLRTDCTDFLFFSGG